jgi:hypothetical protein
MGNDLQNSPLENTIILADFIEKQMKFLSKRVNFLEITVFVMSIITSGALWLLVGEIIPTIMTWVGAIINTLILIITGYVKIMGLNKKRDTVMELHKEVYQLLGEIRGSKIDNPEFWDRYKNLQRRSRALNFIRD